MDHDPGGKIRLKLPEDCASFAMFGGENNCYRYALGRTWKSNPQRFALVVMMNPSTADVSIDDPTVAKVTRMARRWLGGTLDGLLVGNTFAYRATDQSALLTVPDPIGPDNDSWLMNMANDVNLVVLAYGSPKSSALRERGLQVANMLREFNPHVLRLSKNNIPYHPLYLPENTEPQSWSID